MNRLSGKIALVTGATSGMGRATSELLAKEGATIILVGRNEERGNSVVSKIIAEGGKAFFYKCDLSKEENIKNLYNDIKNEFGKLDILFNNAGIWVTKSLDDITEEELNKIFTNNFNSTLFMAKYFVELLSHSNGSMINNASIGGLEGYTSGTKQYMYHSTKAAIIKISKLLAKNYAKTVRVNCICPGLIDTEIFENRDFSRFYNTIPMGRLGKGEEVAKLVLFLASDDSSYITGTVIPIDGGASLT